MKAWGDRPAIASFPGVTSVVKDLGAFVVPKAFHEPNVWYPVPLSNGDTGFFLPTSVKVSDTYTYSPLPSSVPLRLYLQISVVTPENYFRPQTVPSKSQEPFGYLVTLPKGYQADSFVTGVVSRPVTSSVTSESVASKSAEPFLALRLHDLVVHHYPGKATTVSNGSLPDRLQSLLTCI